ncbi:hypothetical protein [Klebsiella pneumoniae]|nr:hypothetical protein [Klebsiella pneumoniae]MED6004903.1 hypothetical protein [Klebsiella pneumoniae]MED6058283.1 hypothetical protein [Klebsiella pneumoniae]
MTVFEKRIQMLEAINKRGVFSRSVFEDLFDISQSQANVILREFIKLGFIEEDKNIYRVTEKTKRIFE